MSRQFGMKLISPRVDAGAYESPGPRLNLVLPYIDTKRSYGGIASALRLFERLGKGFSDLRIILLNHQLSDIDFSAWPDWELDCGRASGRTLKPVPDTMTPLLVHAKDHFLTAPWTSAVYARKAIDRQAALFPEAPRRYVNFIQDYEPAFYPWSAERLYIESLYRDRKSAIVVFNSKQLADFFNARSLNFCEQYTFEPRLHPDLCKKKSEPRSSPKERLILVYARPDLRWTGFDLAVDALRLWARQYPRAAEWNVVSAGDPHDHVALSESVTLRSLGKLTMDDYAEYLSRCSIGVAFQFLPHPHYPRLEMAAFGSWVITNRENSDISHLAANIVSTDESTPEAVAQKLSWCCEQHRSGIMPENPGAVFQDGDDEFPCAGALVRSWMA